MHSRHYGGRFNRTRIVQMTLAEAGIGYELHPALQRMMLIGREPQRHGRCQPGEGISLLDIILSFCIEIC